MARGGGAQYPCALQCARQQRKAQILNQIRKSLPAPVLRAVWISVGRVYSPAGGWWSRPSTWKRNTSLCMLGLAGITYGIWTLSAAKEQWVALSVGVSVRDPSQEAPSSITVDSVHACTFPAALSYSELIHCTSGQGNSLRTSRLSSASTTNRWPSEAKWASGNSLLWPNQPHRTAIISGARHAELGSRAASSGLAMHFEVAPDVHCGLRMPP
jgi:hypothetical protein